MFVLVSLVCSESAGNSWSGNSLPEEYQCISVDCRHHFSFCVEVVWEILLKVFTMVQWLYSIDRYLQTTKKPHRHHHVVSSLRVRAQEEDLTTNHFCKDTFNWPKIIDWRRDKRRKRYHIFCNPCREWSRVLDSIVWRHDVSSWMMFYLFLRDRSRECSMYNRISRRYSKASNLDEWFTLNEDVWFHTTFDREDKKFVRDANPFAWVDKDWHLSIPWWHEHQQTLPYSSKEWAHSTTKWSNREKDRWSSINRKETNVFVVD